MTDLDTLTSDDLARALVDALRARGVAPHAVKIKAGTFYFTDQARLEVRVGVFTRLYISIKRPGHRIPEYMPILGKGRYHLEIQDRLWHSDNLERFMARMAEVIFKMQEEAIAYIAGELASHEKAV